ncbi:MAG: zinc-ribbon domain-containing protein [Candidatus Nanopelagicales bacterium]|nr:zinc-ribbon domain-containing protein [Candidatus Nanopelagicales bacterium]
MPKQPPLSETHPEIAAEAMFDPTTVTSGSHSKLRWKCTAHGHQWEAAVKDRTRGTGCPVCAGRKVLIGFNDLQTTRPDLTREADFDPTTITAHSGKKMPWKCAAKGHEWNAVVANRTSTNPSGCPFCSNQKVLIGFNDLQTTRPEIAREANFDPTTITAGSNKKVPWKCAARGHEWEATVEHRTSRNQGCPVCSNNQVLAGFNDLQTTHPDLAKEAEFDATTIMAGSHSKLPWKCTAHGHQWEATVKGRTGPGASGCPVCAGKKVLAGFNDLQSKYPEVAAEAMIDPTTVLAHSQKKMPWKCTAHGHEWEIAVANRTSTNATGCPFCSNRKVLAGFNDLQTIFPDIAQEAMFDPSTIMAGSHKKLPWKCNVNGHEWKATALNRTFSKSGCPACAETGFNPGDPAWLYLMRHPEWLLQQIGITNQIEDRLKKHASNGWEVLDIRGPMDGYLTQDWEASILRWLTSRNIPRAASGTEESPHFDTPNTGEAWQQSDLTVTSVREIMDLVAADGQ